MELKGGREGADELVNGGEQCVRNVWELGRMQGGKLIIIWRKEQGWDLLDSVTSFVCSACGPSVEKEGGERSQ